jgi:hypothetical protein
MEMAIDWTNCLRPIKISGLLFFNLGSASDGLDLVQTNKNLDIIFSFRLIA